MTDMYDVKTWIQEVNNSPVAQIFDGWKRDLWKKPYDDIVEFLLRRYRITNSEVEYYLCLLYLEKHLSSKLRYLPFKDSDNYKKSIGVVVEKTNSIVKKTQNTFVTFGVLKTR